MIAAVCCVLTKVRNLPKVTPWTKKERNTLSKAIQEDATYLTLVEHIRDQDSMPKSNRRINKKSKKRSLQPRDFIELVDSLRGRDFDWFKISSEHFENVHSPLDCKVMWNVFLHPRINKNSWTKLEDIKLEEIAKGHQFQDWDGVAKELNTNRTAYQCFIRYNTTRKFPKATNCVWEKEEDDRLLKLVKIFKIGNFIPWGEIGSWMKNRTKQQVYFRWTYSLTPCLTKGRFSKSEDNILRDAVSKYGTNFRKISAALMPHRSTVQLHERYQTLTMNQTENWNVWTLKEDSTLLKLFESFGTNWARIAKEFSCKTRIQLRHRHAAIQRYVKRGISIFELHNPHLNSRRIEKNQGKKNEESNQSKLNYNKSASDRDYNVDQELIEYFRKEQTTARSVREQKCYTTNDLNNKTKQLYNILQLLNANLSIPDDINNFKLHDKHRQLLYSLKEYIAAKNAGNMQHKAVVDKCSSLMFGISNTTKEGSRPTLLASSGSRVKLKRSYKTQGIDYHLNTNNTFLVERPKDFQNLDFVTFHIGGNEQELQFEKFSRSLVLHSPKGKLFAQNNEDSFAVSFGTSLDHNNGGINNLNYFKKIRSKNIVDYSPVESSSIHDRVNCAMLPIVNYGKSHKSSTKNITSSDMRNIKKTSDKHINSSAIETTYATLLSLKNLMYFKQLNEIYNNPRQTPAMSKRFQESVRLLEMRLELLFTYPIGLSKTVLPQFYAMDTFSYDDVTPKRKTPKMLKKQKTKLRSHNTSDEDVNQ
ncbi:PREDICTED: uncharacterized protein LOC107187225 [Dufourea novaeangliae]|uniref:uncharacterized protein LOC107187225 n=1 Tax=Dufourea novaeangliae TaxID=178035 RepID=UPI0007670A51|nr:PREDICTED: uncharacterized protein LOC107187225 [Dufourea novaeangliae]